MHTDETVTGRCGGMPVANFIVQEIKCNGLRDAANEVPTCLPFLTAKLTKANCESPTARELYSR